MVASDLLSQLNHLECQKVVRSDLEVRKQIQK